MWKLARWRWLPRYHAQRDLCQIRFLKLGMIVEVCADRRARMWKLARWRWLPRYHAQCDLCQIRFLKLGMIVEVCADRRARTKTIWL
jgi:hypothetical protein